MENNNGWNKEQQAFLNRFYNGVENPDAKMSLLRKALPGQHVITMTQLTPNGIIKSVSESETPIQIQIACLEHDLLLGEGLLVEEYY